MSNGQLHDDKLFQGLHDRLSDYEAPYDGADWDAMSRSLDKLPKTNQFRWKFSLNTIGIMLGIVGLTAVGIVIASGRDGKSPRPAENTSITTKLPSDNSVTAPVQTTKPQPTSTDVAVNDANSNTGLFQGLNSNPAGNADKKPDDNIPFRLGDQIDPAKGFVHETKEDPALMKDHDDLKEPDVYYDIDDNGKVKPIKIKDKDTSEGAHEIKQDSVPQLPADGPEPAAPTEGQRIGFDQ